MTGLFLLSLVTFLNPCESGCPFNGNLINPNLVSLLAVDVANTSTEQACTPSRASSLPSAPSQSDLSSSGSNNKAKASVTRRPTNPCPSGPVDSYREWVKGNDVSTLVKYKLSAAQEARRLKNLQAQENERRALMFVRRMNGSEKDEFFDSRGASDVVYQKLCNNSSTDHEDMEEVL
jgi:hypothetical protein